MSATRSFAALRMTRKALVMTGASMLVLAALGCGGESNVDATDHITVDVGVSGNGSGTVEASDAQVPLNCTIVNGSDPTGCAVTFPDAGGGGAFTLTATPSSGSEFTSWSGCNAVAGPVCSLTFGASAGDTTFLPIVTFTRVASNLVTLYNGATVSASLLAPGETAGAGNLLTPNTTRDVPASSAIGTAIVFRAVVGGSQVAQVTCTVTAAAWQSGQPLAALFDGDGYYMTCNAF